MHESHDTLLDNINTHYSIRISKRAKRLQMRVSSWGRVEVVVPVRINPNVVPKFMSDNAAWLINTLAQTRQKSLQRPEQSLLIPDNISLRAANQDWRVDYVTPRETNRVITKIVECADSNELCISYTSEVAIRKALKRWLTKKAKFILNPWLRQLSENCHLDVEKITIRAQKTRWGSCSSQKNINLNRNILFLPVHLVEYLLVHELCHTRHMNHSKRFWTLVGKIEPLYRELDRELRSADQYVPVWAVMD